MSLLSKNPTRETAQELYKISSRIKRWKDDSGNEEEIMICRELVTAIEAAGNLLLGIANKNTLKLTDKGN